MKMLLLKNKDFKSNIGMFNLFKGIGIVGVIVFHSISSFDFTKLNSYFMSQLLLMVVCLFGGAVMPAFFIISGYGFKKQKYSFARKKVKRILVPYFVMAFVTAVLHFILHFGFFHYFKNALKETVKVAVGFCLALSSNMEFKGIVFYSCGIGWYLIALIGCIILLNLIMNFEGVKPWKYVIIIAIAGVILGYYKIFVFCISQIFTGLFFFYEGYLIKKKKLFQIKWNWLFSLILAITLLINALGIIYRGQMDNIAEGNWNLLIISLFTDGFLAYSILCFFLYLNKFSNNIFKFLKKIGNSSLIVFCIHSVEMKAIPWYLFTQNWKGNPFMGCLILVVMRIIVISVFYFVFCIVHSRLWLTIKRK